MDSEGGGEDIEIVEVVIGFKSGDRITLPCGGHEAAGEVLTVIANGMKDEDVIVTTLSNSVAIRTQEVTFVAPAILLKAP